MSGLSHKSHAVSFDEALYKSYRDRGTISAGVDLYRRIGLRGLYAGFHLHAG